MNLLLLSPDELDGSCARLNDRRAVHLRSVLKVEVGDTVRAGLVGGAVGDATVVAVSDEMVELTFSPGLEQVLRPAVELVLAVPRPKVISRALQHAASFGVGRIDLINAWRVDKSYLDSPRLQPDAVRSDLLLGCEQGRHTWVPEVRVHRRFMGFCEQLDDATSDFRAVAHPSEGLFLSEFRERLQSRRVVIAIGPEGGWIERELETLEDTHGFVRVALSSAVLRSEVAVVACLAQLELVRALEPTA